MDHKWVQAYDDDEVDNTEQITDPEKLREFEALEGVHFTKAAEQSLQKRQLYTLMNDENTKSNFCKLKCIDEQKNFCVNSAFNGGRCCEPDETCQRSIWCSYDNKKAPRMFKYLLCPNEQACESKYMIPKYDGSILTRMVDKYTYKFVQNDVCSYVVRGPGEMQRWDKLWIKIDKIEKCDVYVAKGKSYRWMNHLD